MKNSGKIFEGEIKDSFDLWNKNNADNQIYYFRVKDPPQSFNQSSDTGLRFSSNNPYDIIVFKNTDLQNRIGNFIVLELKSKQTDSLSFNTNLEVKKNCDIKPHQINGLKEVYDKGGKAYFLFNFRKNNITYKMCISDFLRFAESTDKVSINLKDVIEFGGILIPQELKKVKYKYQIEKIWE